MRTARSLNDFGYLLGIVPILSKNTGTKPSALQSTTPPSPSSTAKPEKYSPNTTSTPPATTGATNKEAPAAGRNKLCKQSRDSSDKHHATHHMVELRGFEPLTPCMPCRCATNCATAPRAVSAKEPGFSLAPHTCTIQTRSAFHIIAASLLPKARLQSARDSARFRSRRTR